MVNIWLRESQKSHEGYRKEGLGHVWRLWRTVINVTRNSVSNRSLINHHFCRNHIEVLSRYEQGGIDERLCQYNMMGPWCKPQHHNHPLIIRATIFMNKKGTSIPLLLRSWCQRSMPQYTFYAWISQTTTWPWECWWFERRYPFLTIWCTSCKIVLLCWPSTADIDVISTNRRASSFWHMVLPNTLSRRYWLLG